LKNSYSSVLAVDLGHKHPAVSVILNGKVTSPRFYGEAIGVRRHYYWLRRKLGNKKLLKVIKRIGQKENGKVNDILHNISKDIVDMAKGYDAIIVIGKLKGIRKSARGKGRKFNRIVNNIPFYKLTQYITYKAHWEGIRVYQVPERYTSKLCHKCGKEGKRPRQASFYCKDEKCDRFNKEYPADLNGAVNIGKLSVGYILADRVALTQPIIPPNFSEWKTAPDSDSL